MSTNSNSTFEKERESKGKNPKILSPDLRIKRDDY